MRVLLAAAECSPLARTGGLGEAVAGLGAGLRRIGVDAQVVIPRYRHLAGQRIDIDDLPVWLVNDPPSFDRESIYGPGNGYEDQWLRFGRFAAAVREMAAEYDLLHLHDAHTGPAVLRSPVPTLFTIHNPHYPVLGPLHETAHLVGALPSETAPGGAIEWYGKANFLKAGIVGADAVSTVSPSFAREITTDPTFSGGLHEVLTARRDKIIGILNGIDTDSWNPFADPFLPQPFSVQDLKGREKSRQEVLQHLDLDGGRMLLGAVTRITGQKGIDLLDPIIDDLVGEGFRFALVGNGDLDPMVDEWAARHPQGVGHAPYSEKMSRLVCAGVDAFLMPSRFEPCGLGQMYAMRYGAPPIARLTGGLADTVLDLDEHQVGATGFGFRSLTSSALAETIRRASKTFVQHPAQWQNLQQNGMTTDLSWNKPATQYFSLYENLVKQ